MLSNLEMALSDLGCVVSFLEEAFIEVPDERAEWLSRLLDRTLMLEDDLVEFMANMEVVGCE